MQFRQCLAFLALCGLFLFVLLLSFKMNDQGIGNPQSVGHPAFPATGPWGSPHPGSAFSLVVGDTATVRLQQEVRAGLRSWARSSRRRVRRVGFCLCKPGRIRAWKGAPTSGPLLPTVGTLETPPHRRQKQNLEALRVSFVEWAAQCPLPWVCPSSRLHPCTLGFLVFYKRHPVEPAHPRACLRHLQAEHAVCWVAGRCTQPALPSPWGFLVFTLKPARSCSCNWAVWRTRAHSTRELRLQKPRHSAEGCVLCNSAGYYQAAPLTSTKTPDSTELGEAGARSAAGSLPHSARVLSPETAQVSRGWRVVVSAASQGAHRQELGLE